MSDITDALAVVQLFDSDDALTKISIAALFENGTSGGTSGGDPLFNDDLQMLLDSDAFIVFRG